MKLLTTILLLSSFSFLYSQMVVDKTPWFTSYNLTSITFANDSVGWMTSEEQTLMKSTNGGCSWFEFSKTPLINKVYAFGEKKLIGTYSGRDINTGYGVEPFFCYSESGGLTWNEINFPSGDTILSLFPVSYNELFACGSSQTILKSTDRGVSWTTIYKDTLSKSYFRSIYFFDDKNGWASSYLITGWSAFDGTYRTSDGGDSWTKINDEPAINMQFLTPFFGYSGGREDYIKVTTDGGVTWKKKGDPEYFYNVTFKASKDLVFLSFGWNYNSGGSPNILVSTDSCESWLKTNFYHDEFRINDICIFNSGKVILCGEKGYVGVMDEWLKFRPVNGEYIYKVYSFPDRVYALGRSSFYRVTNNGSTWETIYNELGADETTNLAFTDTLNGLLMMNSHQTSKTTDGGKTWNYIDTLVKAKNGIAVGNTICAYDDNNFLRTTDLGKTWASVNIPNISAIFFIDTLNGWLTVNSENKNLYKTTDGGNTWKNISVIPGFMGIHFFTSDSAVSFRFGHFYYSNNGGINWIEDPLNDPSAFTHYSSDIKILASGECYFIEWADYRAYDETLYDLTLINFHNYKRSTIFSFIGKFHSNFSFYDDVHGWAAGGRKLYQLNYESTLDVNDKINKIPAEFHLFQNYPNPFNASTRIKYSIALAGRVKVQIFDILGRELQILVNEEKAPGTYEVDFKGANLTSGIYLCRVSSGSLDMTRKIVLLK